MKNISDHKEFLKTFKFANFCRKLGDWEGAIQLYLKALRINSHYPEVSNNLAYVLFDQRRYEKALHFFKNAVELDPDRNIFHHNTAMAYASIGNNNQAIFHYQKSILLNPDYVESYYNLAAIYSHEGQIDQALSLYNIVIKKNLGLCEEACFMVDVLTNRNRDYAPTSYLNRLFNSYSSYYDSHMIESLNYSVPDKFKKLLSESGKESYKSGIDIGCGTGLCGIIAKPYVNHLTGADLSKNMLLKASQKKCYDRLIETDIFNDKDLANNYDKFSLIVAGDILIYTGNLEIPMKIFSSLLGKNGDIIFNTESGSHKFYRLNKSGRFSHNTEYINSLLKSYNFSIIRYFEDVVRRENGRDIPGNYYLARYKSLSSKILKSA